MSVFLEIDELIYTFQDLLTVSVAGVHFPLFLHHVKTVDAQTGHELTFMLNRRQNCIFPVVSARFGGFDGVFVLIWGHLWCKSHGLKPIPASFFIILRFHILLGVHYIINIRILYLNRLLSRFSNFIETIISLQIWILVGRQTFLVIWWSDIFIFHSWKLGWGFDIYSRICETESLFLLLAHEWYLIALQTSISFNFLEVEVRSTPIWRRFKIILVFRTLNSCLNHGAYFWVVDARVLRLTPFLKLPLIFLFFQVSGYLASFLSLRPVNCGHFGIYFSDNLYFFKAVLP